jgi:hypothetical protein
MEYSMEYIPSYCISVNLFGRWQKVAWCVDGFPHICWLMFVHLMMWMFRGITIVSPLLDSGDGGERKLGLGKDYMRLYSDTSLWKEHKNDSFIHTIHLRWQWYYGALRTRRVEKSTWLEIGHERFQSLNFKGCVVWFVFLRFLGHHHNFYYDNIESSAGSSTRIPKIFHNRSMKENSTTVLYCTILRPRHNNNENQI